MMVCYLWWIVVFLVVFIIIEVDFLEDSSVFFEEEVNDI